MLKIALSGCSGRMGRVISDIVSSRDGMEIAVGFDIHTEQYADFPIYKDFAAARRLGLTALHALSLPAACAPETAGEFVAQTVCEILREREGSA